MVEDFQGGPGFLAFVFTFLLVVAAIVLFKSMGRHLRKVRTSPQDEGPQGDPVAGEASARLEDGDGGGDVVADEAGDR